MDDKSRVMVATLLGAVAGAAVGYLYLTRDGARFRAEIEPRLDDLLREFHSLRGTVQKARAAASEGWQTLNDFVGEQAERPYGERSPRSTH